MLQSKEPDEQCRFKGIRRFNISKNGMPEGLPIWHGIPEAEGKLASQPVYNETWYRKPEASHIYRLQVCGHGNQGLNLCSGAFRRALQSSCSRCFERSADGLMARRRQ